LDVEDVLENVLAVVDPFNAFLLVFIEILPASLLLLLYYFDEVVVLDILVRQFNLAEVGYRRFSHANIPASISQFLLEHLLTLIIF
jgi:hypothetical protein